MVGLGAKNGAKMQKKKLQPTQKSPQKMFVALKIALCDVFWFKKAENHHFNPIIK